MRNIFKGPWDPVGVVIGSFFGIVTVTVGIAMIATLAENEKSRDPHGSYVRFMSEDIKYFADGRVEGACFATRGSDMMAYVPCDLLTTYIPFRSQGHSNE